MALTDAKIRTAKLRATRYRLTDSHGLSIEISPNGGRHWRYRYKIGGRENIFSPGDWCQAPIGETNAQAEARRAGGRFTLAEVKAERLTWRGQVKTGQHPRSVRQVERLLAATSAADTFEAVTREFIERRGGTWSDGTRKQVNRFMERDVFPIIGDLPIASLTSAHVLAVLREVEARGAITVAYLGRGFIGQVCRYAVAAQKMPADPTSVLRGALVRLPTRHAATLATVATLRDFLAAVAGIGERVTELAVRLLVLTMTRTVEVRHAEWTEIVFAGQEWRIAAHKMKKRRLHIVPLPSQAVALLRELHEITGRGRYLFPNRRDPKRPMGDTTIASVFDRAGYGGQFSPHGTRGTASTLLREAGFPARVVELQLAHLDKSETRRAYDHAELLPARRKMLQAWADMIDAKAPAKAVTSTPASRNSR